MSDDNVETMPQKGGNSPKTPDQILAEIKAANNKKKAEAFKQSAQAIVDEIEKLKTSLSLAEAKLQKTIDEYMADTSKA